jgi:hypothetical protein
MAKRKPKKVEYTFYNQTLIENIKEIILTRRPTTPRWGWCYFMNNEPFGFTGAIKVYATKGGAITDFVYFLSRGVQIKEFLAQLSGVHHDYVGRAEIEALGATTADGYSVRVQIFKNVRKEARQLANELLDSGIIELRRYDINLREYVADE